MITSDQRKQIERMAYDAIKALTGEQLKLRLDYYQNVIIDNGIKSGLFGIAVEYDWVYKSFFMVIDNHKVNTLVPEKREFHNGINIT